MYACGQFMLTYGKNHHNIVTVLQLKLINIFKKWRLLSPQVLKSGHGHLSLLILTVSCPKPEAGTTCLSEALPLQEPVTGKRGEGSAVCLLSFVFPFLG